MATGDLIQFEICGPASLPPIAGNIDGNGCIARMRFEGMAGSVGVTTIATGLLAITVTRPGWNAARVFSATSVTDTLHATDIHRRPFAEHAQKLAVVVGADLDIYVALSEWVFVADGVTSVAVTAGFFGGCTTTTLTTALTNASTLAYPMAQITWVTLANWLRVPAGGVYVEAVADHWGARNGRPVAAVDIYATAGGTTSTAQAIYKLSTQVTTPYKVDCYGATLLPGALPQGEAGLGAIVYPWVGNATWNTNSAEFPDFPTPGTCKLHPLTIDTGTAYARAGAYISHTGAQIGSPTIGVFPLVGGVPTPAPYVSGTTPAYATLSALLLAGRTFNAARGHDDIACIFGVIPSGRILGGYGASLHTAATYPPGLGTSGLMIEPGAPRATTGLANTLGTAPNQPPLRARFEGFNLFPGTPGTVGYSVIGYSAATGNPSSAPTKAAAAYPELVDIDCVGSGPSASSFGVVLLAGYRKYHRCNFTAVSNNILSSSSTNYSALCEWHGGTVDQSGDPATTACNSPSVLGVRGKNVAVAGLPAGAVQTPLGRVVRSARTDFTLLTSNSVGAGREVGMRGESWCNFIGRVVRVGATAGALSGETGSNGNESPAWSVSADYNTGNNTDQPAVQNLVVSHMTIVGGRKNGPYNEAGGGAVAAVRIAKIVYERWSYFSHKNSKGDLWVTSGQAASGLRTGNMAHRYATGIKGVFAKRVTSGPAQFAPTSWFGEVLPPLGGFGGEHGDYFIRDTSLAGTNDFADDGDYTPKTASPLLNVVPAGQAVAGWDMVGTPRRDDGTGAAGAVEKPLASGIGSLASGSLAVNSTVGVGAVRGIVAGGGVAFGGGVEAGAYRGTSVVAALEVAAIAAVTSSGPPPLPASWSIRFDSAVAIDAAPRISAWSIRFDSAVALDAATDLGTIAAVAQARPRVIARLIVGATLGTDALAAPVASASLQTGVLLAAAVAASPTVAATLQTGVLLAAAATVSASAGATLATGVRFAGFVAASAAIVADLDTHVDVATAAVASPAATADLVIGKLIAAAVAARPSMTAALYTRAAFPFEPVLGNDRPRARYQETLDAMLWRITGKGSGAVEALLDETPGLADLGPFLPEGLAVDFAGAALAPVLAAAPRTRDLVQLWD